MDPDCIDYRSLHQFSSLIKDYLDQNPAVQSWYNRFPSLENLKAQLDEKSVQYPHEFRETLVKELHRQYEGISISSEMVEQIESLKDVQTFTITTGHQLNLFTGPVYFIYKIISVIQLCKQLQNAYPMHRFVPVYWMATEDHDFEEIQYFNYKNTKIRWETSQTGAVGRFNIDEDFEAVRMLFSKLIPSGERGDFLHHLFESSYQKGSTLADATRHLVHTLFEPQGLIILDGDAVALKNAFIPYIQKEITEQTAYRSVQATIEQFNAYKVQVNPRELNLFYLGPNFRERILLDKNEVSVQNTSLRWSVSDFLNNVEKQPECVSPNVLLRPLYQEVLLPNLAYVGGGGEIAYWLQLKSMFAEFNIPFPILVLRNSVLNCTAKQDQKRRKLKVNYSDLFLPTETLRNQVTQSISTLQFNFEAQKKVLTDQFEQLRAIALQTDKSFTGAVNAQEKKQIKGLENLQKRLLRAEKRVHQEYLNQVVDLQNELFPKNGLQERSANFSSFYMDFGPDWFTHLYQEINPLTSCFSVLVFE